VTKAAPGSSPGQAPGAGLEQAFTTAFGIAQWHLALIRCRKAGIDPWLTDLAILFSFPEAIEQLSAALFDRGQQAKLGKDLARYLIGRLFARCHEQRLLPPATLVTLLMLHLEPEKFAADQLQNPGGLARASHYYYEHPWASDREISKHAKVSARKIAEWRASGALANGTLHALYYER
jgi:hypothetical protein